MFKKKALYVHDHVFIRDAEGNYYSEGKITDSVFERYENCCSEIHVLSRATISAPNRSHSKITKKTVHFHPVKNQSFSKIFSINLISTLKSVLILTKESNIVILRLPSFLGSVVYVFARAFRRPYFVELVGDPGESISSSATKKYFGLINLLAVVMKKTTQHAVFHAAGVIYVTEKTLQKKFPTRGFSASASNVELTISTTKPSYGKYKIDEPPINIGLIGSFKNNYKGIDTAIESISTLTKRGIKCNLRILGTGNSLPYLDLASSLGISDNVFFDGVRQTGEGVYAWLDSLDIYIQPSRTEGLPRSLIEAMSRGLPCVGSNVGGIPELLAPEWTFTKDSPMELTDKIEHLINSHDKRHSAGVTNFLCSKKYSKEVLREKRELFWRKANNHINGLV